MKRILSFFSENGFRRTGFVAMVLSGVVMLFNSGYTLYHKEKVRINVTTLDKGLETQLKWKQRSFALEIAFNEGLEVEKAISFDDLPTKKKAEARQLARSGKTILIEKVYS